MNQTSLAIPTTIADPRCFVLLPVLDKSQAYTQAGEHKGRVFTFDPKQVLRTLGRKRAPGIEAELLERRLVPFWHVRCRSHFDYTRMKDYTIAANDRDAVSITIQGNDHQGNPIEMIYRVDQTGRSGGQVKLTGIERCITERNAEQWIDSYTRTEDWVAKQLEEHQKIMRESTKLKPRPVSDLGEFGANLRIDGEQLFRDDVKTIVVPPLETADNVVRRALQQVMVSIEAATIYDWALEVMTIDLYFRPLYVFQFERRDESGSTNGLKLEELDGLNKDRWVTLQATEFQMPDIPWVKILKLSADIGAIVLRDAPVLGTSLKIATTIADQGPGIISDIKK
jgi:hypothetical protein